MNRELRAAGLNPMRAKYPETKLFGNQKTVSFLQEREGAYNAYFAELFTKGNISPSGALMMPKLSWNLRGWLKKEKGRDALYQAAEEDAGQETVGKQDI